MKFENDEYIVIRKIDTKGGFEIETFFPEDIVKLSIQEFEALEEQLDRARLRLMAIKEKYADRINS